MIRYIYMFLYNTLTILRKYISERGSILKSIETKQGYKT